MPQNQRHVIAKIIYLVKFEEEGFTGSGYVKILW